ncbi:MAG: hypothetical protein ACKV22_41515 [Bryobacteraceae bacterium]
MRGLGLQLCIIVLWWVAGCAYTVPLTPVEVENISNHRGTKIPGQFSAKIATEDCCKKEVRSELLMCQAPTYHVNGDRTVEASIKAALPTIFEDVVIGQSDRANDLTIAINRFDVTVRFDPVGVLPTVQATADVGLTIEAKRGGQSLMIGHAYAQQANVGRVVLFCAEASSTIADAVNAATREALNKLTELMVNSAMLRDLGGLPSQKQAQAK